jgi:hypothetical protein
LTAAGSSLRPTTPKRPSWGARFRFVPGLEAALARRFDRLVEVGDARVYLR